MSRAVPTSLARRRCCRPYTTRCLSEGRARPPTGGPRWGCDGERRHGGGQGAGRLLRQLHRSRRGLGRVGGHRARGSRVHDAAPGLGLPARVQLRPGHGRRPEEMRPGDAAAHRGLPALGLCRPRVGGGLRHRPPGAIRPAPAGARGGLPTRQAVGGGGLRRHRGRRRAPGPAGPAGGGRRGTAAAHGGPLPRSLARPLPRAPPPRLERGGPQPQLRRS